MIYGFWNDVKLSVIWSSFSKAGFRWLAEVKLQNPGSPNEDLLEQPSVSIWRLVQVPGISFKDFVTLDNHVMVAPDLNDHVIIDAVIMPDENDKQRR